METLKRAPPPPPAQRKVTRRVKRVENWVSRVCVLCSYVCGGTFYLGCFKVMWMSFGTLVHRWKISFSKLYSYMYICDSFPTKLCIKLTQTAKSIPYILKLRMKYK